MTHRIALLAASLLLGALSAAPAYEFVRTQAYTLPPEGSVEGQILVLADEASLQGAVADDVFLVAGKATLTGTNANDTWIVGSVIDAAGVYGDHLRIAGNSITFRGAASNGVAIAGNSVDLTTGSVIRASVHVAASACVIAGEVDGPVRVIAERVTLSGRVNGSVHLVAGDIVVMPGAAIAGDLRYTSPNEVILPTGVTLGGELVRETPSADAIAQPGLAEIALRQGLLLIGAILVGIPFMAVFPLYVGRSVRALRTSPLKAVITGALTLLAIPAVAFVSILSVVGIPMGLLLAGFGGAIAYLAKIVIALVVGGGILRLRGEQGFGASVLALLAGLSVLYVFAALPVIGGAVSMAIVLLGSGALLLGIAPAARIAAEPPAVPGAEGDRSPPDARM